VESFKQPLISATFLQVQQQIAQEYEQVKATTNTLQLFRVDTRVDRPIGEKMECCQERE
jgi:hypothetical protein